MSRVRLDNVTKVYDEDVLAVERLNLDIKDGEFMVFVGPSGCGKSTTLRMIAGLEQVTDGEIELSGQIVNQLRPQDRDIAMVFQNYALYPHMTVRRNMEFGLRLSEDYSDVEVMERVNETAEMLEISELLDDYPRQLSGGQQQRVALGRAIVRDPDVFLLDEPLSNLDAKLRTQMRTELQRLQAQLDVTTIYVTHDQTEAMTMGDRIAILNDGELQQVATPDMCYDNPENKFVAGFIGSPSMNFFEVEATNVNDGTHFTNPAFETILPISVRERSYTLGVRPEDFSIVEDGRIDARLEVVEPVGADNFLHLRLSESNQEVTARVSNSYRLTEGELVELNFDPVDAHLFDEEGNRINPEVPPTI
jgi:multiple sugar transport system ATP-binding protein